MSVFIGWFLLSAFFLILNFKGKKDDDLAYKKVMEWKVEKCNEVDNQV